MDQTVLREISEERIARTTDVIRQALQAIREEAHRYGFNAHTKWHNPYARKIAALEETLRQLAMAKEQAIGRAQH